jgi:pimeloyl-ACP methyl ester carboxylesterase
MGDPDGDQDPRRDIRDHAAARRGQANSRGHGRWLAGLFTDAKLVEIEDSCTLIPEDQPERLARELREFVKA